MVVIWEVEERNEGKKVYRKSEYIQMGAHSGRRE